MPFDLLSNQDYVSVAGMRDIQRVKAATTAAPEGAEALCCLQGGTTEGIIRSNPVLFHPNFVN